MGIFFNRFNSLELGVAYYFLRDHVGALMFEIYTKPLNTNSSLSKRLVGEFHFVATPTHNS